MDGEPAAAVAAAVTTEGGAGGGVEGGRRATASRPGAGASAVFAGVLASRMAGLVRDRVLAHALGLGAHADVFAVALRGPNLVQNLLGEGSLSASFIPIYARFLADGRERDAARFAGAVFGLLALLAGAASLAGIALARPLVALFSPGFLEDARQAGAAVDRFALAVEAVRFTFPMVGLLVLSAWGLGILNSHRRFFLSYVAPVGWNAAIVTAVLSAVGRGAPAPDLLRAACWGALVGGVVQCLVLLPGVWRSMPAGFAPWPAFGAPGVKDAVRAFGPAVLGRGAVQIGSYLDIALASFLAIGAVGALRSASTLYLLPISLFAMSVAAAELPDLARGAVPRGPGASDFDRRLADGLTRIGFLCVPSAVGFLVLGGAVVDLVFRTGAFGAEASRLTAAILAAYSLGLVAATSSRLLQNGFFALGDTRTPARIAVQRLILSAAAGVPLMLLLDRVGIERLALPGGAVPSAPPVAVAAGLRLGAAGLALGASLAAWFELARLAGALRRHRPGFALPWRRLGVFAGLGAAAALLGLGAGWVVARTVPAAPAAIRAAAAIGVCGSVYLLLAAGIGIPEARAVAGAVRRRVGRNHAAGGP